MVIHGEVIDYLKKWIQSEMAISVHKIFDIVADLYIFI